MSPQDLRELAEILDAGWNSDRMHKRMPAGDAVAIALDGMARKAREIAHRKTTALAQQERERAARRPT